MSVMTIVGSGEEECAFCQKSKPGVAVEIDGEESFLCWGDLKRFVTMMANARRNMQARGQAVHNQ